MKKKLMSLSRLFYFKNKKKAGESGR